MSEQKGLSQNIASKLVTRTENEAVLSLSYLPSCPILRQSLSQVAALLGGNCFFFLHLTCLFLSHW